MGGRAAGGLVSRDVGSLVSWGGGWEGRAAGGVVSGNVGSLAS